MHFCLLVGAGQGQGSSYPTLSSLQAFLQGQHRRLERQAQPADKLLLEPKSFLALIRFLRDCREHADFTEADILSFQGTTFLLKFSFQLSNLLIALRNNLHLSSSVMEINTPRTVINPHAYHPVSGADETQSG